jgi:hypothetical protein
MIGQAAKKIKGEQKSKERKEPSMYSYRRTKKKGYRYIITYIYKSSLLYRHLITRYSCSTAVLASYNATTEGACAGLLGGR